MLVWCAFAAMAQDIQVTRDGGAEVTAGATTEIRFEANKPTPIHRVVAESMAFSLYSVGVGQTSTAVCTAPCTLEVPNGTYRFRVGNNAALAAPFSVVADGRMQAYQVRDTRKGGLAAGMLMSILGTSAAISGAIIYAIDSDRPPVAAGMAVVGTPVAVIGWPLLLGSVPKARRLR